MTSEAGVTSACCSPPAVVRERDGYELQGKIQKFGGIDAYVTGNANSKRGIIFVYDIFGFYPTTQQGADVLARELDAQVVMPDFAHGKPYDSDRFLNPPEGVDVMGELGQTFFHPNFMSERFDELKAVAKQFKDDGKTYVGAHGLCWGGRVVLTAGSWPEKYIHGASTSHPAALDEKDGDNVLVPVGIYPSKDDPADVAEKIVNNVKAKPFGAASDFKNYSNMHHGWSGAHAWLDKEDNYKEFADVYGRVARFHEKAAEVHAS